MVIKLGINDGLRGGKATDDEFSGLVFAVLVLTKIIMLLVARDYGWDWWIKWWRRGTGPSHRWRCRGARWV